MLCNDVDSTRLRSRETDLRSLKTLGQLQYVESDKGILAVILHNAARRLLLTGLSDVQLKFTSSKFEKMHGT